MPSSIEKYDADLTALIKRGERLLLAIQNECHPEEFLQALTKAVGNKTKALETITGLPSFGNEYQSWYSEAKSLVKQLLPDRLEDLVRQYEKPKGRKEFSHGTYVIEDYLHNVVKYRYEGGPKIVDKSSAIPRFEQQINIIKSIKQRFKSTLFDIRQLVQADLFDSELDAARELLKNKFGRASGAMAGVVLEQHLEQVCVNHHVKIIKKNPTIGDLNDLLKQENVIDTPQWRFIQHLGDLRNICDHNKKVEPTIDDVNDLISGVEKITKTLF